MYNGTNTNGMNELKQYYSLVNARNMSDNRESSDNGVPIWQTLSYIQIKNYWLCQHLKTKEEKKKGKTDLHMVLIELNVNCPPDPYTRNTKPAQRIITLIPTIVRPLFLQCTSTYKLKTKSQWVSNGR